MALDAVVIIPTYNERENIADLIEAINKLALSLDILIVDDNSPDKTGDFVNSLRGSIPNLDIVHRKRKEGLGPAYIEGFKYALNKGAYKYIIQMDGDFSHNPSSISSLLDGARKCDVGIGSRYIEGGGVSDLWNISRKLISRCGNLYARIIMGLKTRDCTGGFRCYRKEVLEAIDFNKKFLNGYGFQVQLLYEITRKNFSTCEMPIFFEERLKGASKMSAHIVAEAFFSLALLRIKSVLFKK